MNWKTFIKRYMDYWKQPNLALTIDKAYRDLYQYKTTMN